jgi:hypothetical protein
MLLKLSLRGVLLGSGSLALWGLFVADGVGLAAARRALRCCLCCAWCWRGFCWGLGLVDLNGYRLVAEWLLGKAAFGFDHVDGPAPVDAVAADLQVGALREW